MARRLFVVEHVVVIERRGIALVPGILVEGEERFRAGDPIVLRKPDGSSTIMKIGALELMCPNPRGEVTIMLAHLGREDVPVGTEVWSIDVPDQGVVGRR